MLKNITTILMVCFVVGLIAGCSSTRQTVTQTSAETSVTTRKIETNFYVEDRKRVDQEMKGNFGYLQGTPVPEDRSQYKDTRKIYVLEVTKNVDKTVTMMNAEQLNAYQPSPSKPLPPMEEFDEPEWTEPVAIPVIRQKSKEEYFEDYVIEEGDTLQKISKKFYGSYSQWLKIFETNNDVLKDPNRIKPGTKIKVPMYK